MRILLSAACQLLAACLAAHACAPAGWGGRGAGLLSGQNNPADNSALGALVRKSAHPVAGAAGDYDPLMRLVGDARFVLLGEATHGTHEFYRERARITRRLVEEKGFDAVVLEADWPDAYRVSEYVQGRGRDATAEQSLSGFTRFPRWMWRNEEFRDLAAWLRSHNDAQKAGAAKVGVYGMDLYSLSRSADAVVAYLKRTDSDAAGRARKRYGCFYGYRDRPERYGQDVAARQIGSCEKQAAEQFREMEQLLAAWRARPDRRRDDDLFSAYQNARVVKNAEAYYRQVYEGRFSTWNLRDSHMAETLNALAEYLDVMGAGKSKIVVWAHNTHQGDARMTEMGERGELNVGHLMRRSHAADSVLVGFTTYAGEVRAANEWGEAGRVMKVRPALPESFSALFHETGVPNFLLIMRGAEEQLSRALGEPRLERAIGVVYLPATERRSHYFEARMSRQFDAVIHLDVTRAVTPIK
ncbi:MAG TPA: erythromycin esterase family protein [Pyrinomonadaceae bacterium]|nr:erythromycin esterase family protein [Pyrinomonadaceae bacterium]